MPHQEFACQRACSMLQETRRFEKTPSRFACAIHRRTAPRNPRNIHRRRLRTSGLSHETIWPASAGPPLSNLSTCEILQKHLLKELPCRATGDGGGRAGSSGSWEAAGRRKGRRRPPWRRKGHRRRRRCRQCLHQGAECKAPSGVGHTIHICLLRCRVGAQARTVPGLAKGG